MRGLVLLCIVLLAGCASGTMMGAGQGGRTEDGRSYEAARADNLLAAAVNRALVHDKTVNAGDIRVTVRDSVVTLSGTAASASGAEHIVSLVREIDGVRGVINNLRVSR